MHTAYVPEEFMPIVAVFALFVHTLELYQFINKFTSELVTSTLFTSVEIQLCNSIHNTVDTDVIPSLHRLSNGIISGNRKKRTTVR